MPDIAAYLGSMSAMGGGGASEGPTLGATGGGGGAPAIPDTGMSMPAVSNSSASTATTYTPTGTNVTSGNSKSIGDVYIDGSKIGQIIFKNANQQQLNVV